MVSSSNLQQRDLEARSKQFAVQVARVVFALPEGRRTEVLVKQLLRAATAVGANYRSACHAKSRADFIAKMSIAEEEADEVQYWLELMVELDLLDQETFKRLHREAQELTAIFVASGKTAKANR